MTDHAADDTLERRLVVGTSGAASAYCAVAAIANSLLTADVWLTYGCIAACVAYGAVSVLAARAADVGRAAVGFVASSFAFLAVTWEPNGGVRGSTSILFPVLVVFAILASPARRAFAVTAAVVVLLLGLTAYELRDGHLARSPFTETADGLDSTLTTFLAISLCAVAVAGTRSAYERERTRLAAANRAAEQAAERARAADATKSAFLARMSHDLRTPLAAVVGSLDVVARDPARPDAATLLEGARARCEDLQAVVAELLEVELGQKHPALGTSAERVRAPAGPPPAAAPATARTEADAVVTGLRVLVADDEPVMRTTLDAMLDVLGCEVVTVGDGAAALAAARSSRFDVVLLDVNMPVLDGLSAARTLRAERADLPLVAVTANAYPDDVAACTAAGIDVFLAKPVTLDQLRAALVRARAARRD